MAKSVEEIMEDACEKLSSFDSKGALAAGKNLVSMRYSGGYEIMALAYLQDDKLDRAIKVLVEGVAKFPSVWLLWQLLGNCHSDKKDYDKASACYLKALECPGASESSIHLNMAIILSRQDQYQASNLELSLVTDKETIPRRESVRFANLIGLELYDDVIQQATDIAQMIEVEYAETDNASSDVAAIFAALAKALLLGRKDIPRARDAAYRALVHNKTDEQALTVIREVNGLSKGERGKLYRLMARGKWFEPFEGEDILPSFFTTYWVLADSEDEGLALASQLEPQEVRTTLVVEELSVEQPEKWQTLKGVYSRSGYAFFEDDD